MSNSLNIVIPFVAPSVNHYKAPKRGGGTYVTKEATAFFDAVAVCARIASGSASIEAERYAVEAKIYLGARMKGDVDNFAKCTLDALVHAHVIHSDAAITDLILRKRRDYEHPRTDISIFNADTHKMITLNAQLVDAIRQRITAHSPQRVGLLNAFIAERVVDAYRALGAAL